MVNEEIPILIEIQNMEYAVLRINSSVYEKISIESKKFDKIEEGEIDEGKELFSQSFKRYHYLITEHYSYETQKTEILQEKYVSFLKSSEVFVSSINLESREKFENSEKSLLTHLSEIKSDWNKHIQNTKNNQNRRSKRYELIIVIFTIFASFFALTLGYFFKRADDGRKMSQLKLMDNSRLASLGEMDENTFKSGMDTIDDTVGRISKIIKGLKNPRPWKYG